jgi:hypothetical protein
MMYPNNSQDTKNIRVKNNKSTYMNNMAEERNSQLERVAQTAATRQDQQQTKSTWPTTASPRALSMSNAVI